MTIPSQGLSLGKKEEYGNKVELEIDHFAHRAILCLNFLCVAILS